MKKITTTLFLLSLLCVTTYAQAGQDQLATVSRSFKERMDREMPGWTHRSIEPIEGSKNVIIDQWELGDITLKLAVTQYDSEAASVQALRDFRSQLQTEEAATIAKGNKKFHLIKENLPNLGDGGLAWDVRGSEAVSFRRGKFLVFISLASPEHTNDVYFSKEFARR